MAIRAASHEKETRYWDFDGYFQTLMTLPPPEDMPLPSDWVIPDPRTTSLLHFLLRSTMLLTERAGRREFAAYLDFSRLCARYAMFFAMASDPVAALGPPDWATWFHDVIIAAVQAEHPRAAEIAVTTTLDRRLYARSFVAQGKIEISAVTREYLQTLNLMTWNFASAIDDGLIPSKRVDELDFVGVVLPSLLSIYRDVSISRLPTPRVRSRDVLLNAVRTTRIQLTFLLAHEYAHALIHDAAPQSAEAETEADKFAYDVLMNQPEEFESGEVWLALRWFFRTAALERLVGEILYGKTDIDWDQDAVMRRSYMMFEYAKQQPPERQTHQLEITGTYLLMRAKGQLRDRGALWLRSYADDYQRQFGWDGASTDSYTWKQDIYTPRSNQARH